MQLIFSIEIKTHFGRVPQLNWIANANSKFIGIEELLGTDHIFDKIGDAVEYLKTHHKVRFRKPNADVESNVGNGIRRLGNAVSFDTLSHEGDGDQDTDHWNWFIYNWRRCQVLENTSQS